MQVPLADGQSKIIGTLEVNWNINLITRNKGIRKQEILLLEFCKNTQKQKRGQREQTMSTMSTQQSTCFCCLDDLSYGLNTLGPLCLWQCFLNFLINDQLTTEIVIFVRTGVGVTSTGLLISNQGGRWWSGQSGQSRPGSIYHHTPPVTCAQSRQSTSLVTDQVTSLAKSKYYTTLIGTLWKQFKGLAILRIHIPKFYVVLGIAWLVHWMGT